MSAAPAVTPPSRTVAGTPPPRTVATTPVRPSPAAEWGLLAATLVAAAGLCRMASGGVGGEALGPLLGTAVVGFAVPAVLLRTRLGPPLAAVVGTVALVVVAVWTAVLRTGTAWFPTGGALRTLVTDLRDARAALAAFHLPLHAGPGVVLLGAMVTGLAGLAGRLLLGPFRTRRPRPHPAVALLPALALVAWSCTAVPGTGAAVLAAAFVAAVTPALAGVAAQRAGQGATTPGGPARPRPGPAATAFLIGLLSMAGAVGIGIPLGIAGTAVGSTAVPANALSLTTGLVQVERDDADVVLFRAHSPVPTYWQVGALTVWHDDRWVPGPDTAAVLRGGTAPRAPAPARAVSSQAHRFTTSVTIGSLSSRLLPVPPSTVQISGVTGAVVTAAGIVAPLASVPGESYTATAVEPAVTSGASSAVGSGAGGLTTAQLAPYLALPLIPSTVGALARQVTAIAASPLSQAEALVNWFRSGRFHYTLTPPPAPAGTNPLVAFLTISRAGSCESFSGAFAVMARSLGLPTRVAVGFTAGQAAGGQEVVRGADAHAWPEVYLGATLGWVSFEPTPAQPSGAIAPANVIGPTAVQLPSPTSSPTTTPTTVPSSPTTVPPVPTTTPATVPVPVTTAVRSGLGWWLPVLVVLAVALLAAGTGLLVRRRRRRRRAAPPGQRAVAAYRRAERALQRAGIGRPPNRTPVAHARELLDAATRSHRTIATPSADELLAALRDLLDLALLVEQAGYSPHPLTPAQAATAEATAARIRQTLRRPTVRTLARELPLPYAGSRASAAPTAPGRA